MLDPKVIPYEVRKGIPKKGGNGGKLVCHGRKPGTLTFSQEDGEFYIYATRVRNIEGCRLPAGKYWLSVVPYCTNKNDSNCTYWRMFLMNDDGVMRIRTVLLNPRTILSSILRFSGRTGTRVGSFRPVSASASAWKEQLVQKVSRIGLSSLSANRPLHSTPPSPGTVDMAAEGKLKT